MKWLVSTSRRLAAAAALAACSGVAPDVSRAGQLPMAPLKDSGRQVYPAFEGWYQNPDGTYNLLLGYYNRNQKQTLDIPIGPNNRVEPGGPDLGQPTYFLVGRGWGVFAIKVPKDFGDKKLTWTIVANGKTVSVPVGLHQGLPDRAVQGRRRGQHAAGARSSRPTRARPSRAADAGAARRS